MNTVTLEQLQAHQFADIDRVFREQNPAELEKVENYWARQAVFYIKSHVPGWEHMAENAATLSAHANDLLSAFREDHQGAKVLKRPRTVTAVIESSYEPAANGLVEDDEPDLNGEPPELE